MLMWQRGVNYESIRGLCIAFFQDGQLTELMEKLSVLESIDIYTSWTIKLTHSDRDTVLEEEWL